MDPTAKIRALNDALRELTGSGRIFVTAGIAALSPDEQVEIMRRVHSFTAFTPDNDPYGEHDFGSFDYDGKTIFWKIDLYDRDLESGSPDPADEAVTTRVLTVLLVEEY
jgi:enolase